MVRTTSDANAMRFTCNDPKIYVSTTKPTSPRNVCERILIGVFPLESGPCCSILSLSVKLMSLKHIFQVLPVLKVKFCPRLNPGTDRKNASYTNVNDVTFNKNVPS